MAATVQQVTPTAVSATDQFVALMTSSHSRCGAHSPARHVCCVAPLAHQIWRDWVVSTSRKFALVIDERSGGGGGAADRYSIVTWSVAFDVSLTTLGMITRDVVVSDAKGWVAPGVTVLKKQQPGSGCTYLCLHKAESAAVDSLGRNERHVRNHGGLDCCGALNAKWWVTLGWRARTNGASITITRLNTSQGIPKERTMPDAKVSMLLPESVSRTMRTFCNHTVPDEVLLTSSCCETTTISFTLFDVLKTYESQKFTALIQTSTESRQDSFGPGTSLQSPDAALVLRRKKTDGAVIFIVKSYGNFVFQVEADTGTARVLSARCSDLSQLDDSVFCVGRAWDNSYQLWDCNDTRQPLRCTNCGDTFDQVVCGRGLLFAVQTSDRKILVIESGVVVISFDVLPSGGGDFCINQQSSLLW